MLFHKEEKATVFLLEIYCMDHPNSKLLFEFLDGESYLATYYTSYESDNFHAVEVGIEEEEDDFNEIAFQVSEVIKPGPHKDPNYDSLLINYKNFPERVINTENNEVVFPPKEAS
ncbi:MAG: hypothetical protein FWE41_00215 [Coriobacteriia bacterium]|nr:hypothetical protein [Coriobacteriia bacterium]MCL2750667.1 hypothetical protein [Coriobacteriia bacterium]